MGNIPYISDNDNGEKTLYVDGKPYIILGGELHNSSASSLEYMEEEVWPYLKDIPLDTVLLPVYWENIEPVEDQFDFTLLDGLVKQARREGVKLILLWFGLWKNGQSSYVPGWVKEDYQRFFRSCYKIGHPSETISPFCQEAVAADARAFSRLMEHLREVDGDENTVIMVQVENEIGFLGAERDFSPAAEEAFRKEVPEVIESIYNCTGSWKDALGEDAAEIFMTYYYALAVEEIAAEGKANYPLPMYVNAWLEQFPERPGSYPSGGPIAKTIHLWQEVTSSIDIFAPDIYLSDFTSVCDKYTRHGNPLFIPEARRDPVTASNVFYAFAHYNTICFAPFGIEDFMQEQYLELDQELNEELNIDMEAFSCQGTGPYLIRSYEILRNIKDLILKYRGSKKLKGFIRRNNHEKGCILSLTNFDLQLTYQDQKARKTGTAGMVIEESADSFWVIGCNVGIKVLPKKSSNEYISIVKLEEGEFEDSIWKPGRVLNGDDRYFIRLGDMADVRKIKVCKHKKINESQV